MLLPAIDLVNESLEVLESNLLSTHRAIYNTLDNGYSELDIIEMSPLNIPDMLSQVEIHRVLP